MKKSLAVVLMCVALSAPALAASVASKGQMLYDANGGRLAPVLRVTDNGAVAIIIDGKVVTVPADTLTNKDGKLSTTLTKDKVIGLPS